MASPNPTYDIILKLPDGKKYEYKNATNFEWNRYENEPGRCRFAIAHTDPNIAAITTDTQFIQILIYRNQSLVWQGFIAFIQDDKDKTTIYGLTFLECLKWYRSGYNVTYTAQTIGTQILSPIWDLIDARSGAILGDLIKKGTFEDPLASEGGAAKTVTKTVMDEDYFSLCQLMIALSRANTPVGSWYQETVMDISLSETAPTFSFSKNVGEDKTQLVWELNSEIEDFTQTKDFRFIRNDVKGLAVASTPAILTSTQTDSTSNSSYYLREISQMFNLATTQGGLDELSKDALKQYKDPQTEWYVSFVAGLVPFDGYVMGDNLRIRMERGRVDVDTYFRVVGMEVSVNDKGGEITRPILRKKRT